MKLDLIIAGDEAVMGFSSSEIKRLRIACESGLGSMELECVELLGDSIDEVKVVFKRGWINLCQHMVFTK